MCGGEDVSEQPVSAGKGPATGPRARVSTAGLRLGSSSLSIGAWPLNSCTECQTPRGNWACILGFCMAWCRHCLHSYLAALRTRSGALACQECLCRPRPPGIRGVAAVHLNVAGIVRNQSDVARLRIRIAIPFQNAGEGHTDK